MPTLPTFQPASAPGAGARIAFDTLTQQQSMMDRASQLRMAQETHALKMQEAEIMRPVVEAQAKADIVAAGAKLSGLKRTEDMRASTYGMADTARAAFNEMMLLSDPDAREQAAQEWIGKYSQLENIKELEPEWKAFHNAIAKIQLNAMTLRQLSAKTEAEKELIAARGKEAEKIANVRTDGARDVATIRADAQKHEAVRLREAAASAREAGDVEGAAFYESILKRKGHIAEPKKLEIERLRELRAAAEDAGDAQAVKDYGDRIAKLNTIVLDPMKQAVATVITNNAGGGKPTETKPAPVASPAAPKPAAQMSEDELKNYFFGPKK